MQKGITMVQLIITMIIMLVIASIAILYSQNTSIEAKIAKSYTSLKAVKEATEQAINLIEINPDEYIESNFFDTPVNANLYYERIGLSSSSDLSNRSYLINGENAKKIDMDYVANEFVVDLENRKYYLVDGIERGNEPTAYEYFDLLKLYETFYK